MVEMIPPPDPHTLLPPFLACLPTSFASTRPPPALLLLLSPILRQRVQLLTSTGSSSSDSWLRLLCWDSAKAEQLKDIVADGTYEAHPISGEIEIEEVDTITYKRFDSETLRSQVPLPEWSLTVLYLWCSGDQQGGGSGWRVTELLPYDNDLERDETWSSTISEANEISQTRIVSDALRDAEAQSGQVRDEDDDDDDDDYDYWAQYDATPGRTPAAKRSPGPNAAMSNHQGSSTEDSYYAQYSDVQPTMDAHDPSEETEDIGESTLNGGVLASIMRRQSQSMSGAEPPPYLSVGHSEDAVEEDPDITQPQPSSPSSTGSQRVARLEQSAESQSASEIGIRQHISTSVKSLFRLARSSGMSREEFETTIKREMDILPLMERDD